MPDKFDTLRDILNKKTEECVRLRSGMLSGMALAFLDKTGLQPDECELVEQMKDQSVVYFFRKKE